MAETVSELSTVHSGAQSENTLCVQHCLPWVPFLPTAGEKDGCTHDYRTKNDHLTFEKDQTKQKGKEEQCPWIYLWHRFKYPAANSCHQCQFSIFCQFDLSICFQAVVKCPLPTVLPYFLKQNDQYGKSFSKNFSTCADST